ncbi:MAG: AhpC/TSA family protein, partial [Sphingobacteriales bacterium]
MKTTLKVSRNSLAIYISLLFGIILIVSCRTSKSPSSKPQEKAQKEIKKQQYDYTIRGTIEGKYPINNAIIFTQDYKLIGIAPVKDRQFSFSGMYAASDTTKFTPAYYVLCTERDSLEHGDQGISRLVYLDREVNLKFHSGTLKYQVEGGPMNRLENEFLKSSEYFKNESDSLKKVLISQTKLAGADTASEKVQEMGTFYHYRRLARTDSVYLNLIKANPASPVSLDHYKYIVLFPFASNLPVKAQRQIFDKFDPKLRATRLAKEINARIIIKEFRQGNGLKYPPKIPIGGKMRSFTFPNLNNKPVKIKDVFARNKYTLIEFWTTFCVPCLEEVPNMLEAKRTYKNKRFEIIMVSSDSKEERGRLKGIIRTYKMDSLIQLSDTPG